MIENPYKVTPFGGDCLGNCSGWLVDRYIWVKRPWSKRADGCCLEHEIYAQFVGNIYEPEDREIEHNAAKALCDWLNRGGSPSERNSNAHLDYALDSVAIQHGYAA